MKLSILIPTLGTRPKELNRLMSSIRDQDYINYEVIIVSQDNHEDVDDIIKNYGSMDIKHVRLDIRGLSHARNEGLKVSSGEIIMLSDDDCWYKENAFKSIVDTFRNKNIKILLSQIYDYDNQKLYKAYPADEGYITNKLQLMSKSSIEIAFLKEEVDAVFDERFGVGAEFVCGEEVDFLLNNFRKKAIYYVPLITVYHPRKNNENSLMIVAKGALYAKHFSLVTAYAVLLRDFIVKKEKNYTDFMAGYRKTKR